MDFLERVKTDFELHSVKGIQECFDNGVDPNGKINGLPILYHLVNMYSRGPLFKACIKVFVDNGLHFDDQPLLAVLLDDADLLEKHLVDNKNALEERYSFDCAFTPLYEASLLHICAEYNHVSCAEVLVKHGMRVDVKAGVDEHGFGGHTPIFHTVNQHANKSMDMLKWLVSLQADLALTVKGLVWGKGYEWETFIPAVNPISYSMMGLLRQFQRKEAQIYEVVSLLMKVQYGINYSPSNVPNKYLDGANS